MKISPTLSLNLVLLVVNLNYNLFAIGKITNNPNCFVKFTRCCFQTVWGRIGHGKLKDGLYHMGTNWRSGCLGSQNLVSTHITNYDKIFLSHNHLGHPSFSLLKKLSSLFENNNICNFQYESSTLTKHHQVNLSIKELQFVFPFSLIHLDV